MQGAQIFAGLADIMPGFRAAAAGRLDRSDFVHAATDGASLAPLRGALESLAASQRAVYDELGGMLEFGAADELLMSANRGYLLLKIHHPTGLWIAVWLGGGGNIGYLRLWLRRALSDLARAEGR